MKMNLAELLQYGPIISQDEDLKIIVQVNGAYFNFYQEVEPGMFLTLDHVVAVNPKEFGGDNGLYRADMAKVIDKAKDFLDEFIKGGSDD